MGAALLFRLVLRASMLTPWLWFSGVDAQTTRADLRVDDPRPVAEALLVLARRDPTIVTYEDPRYEYSGDVADAKIEARRDPSTGFARLLVPRGGRLSVAYEVVEATGQIADIGSTLASLVEAKNRKSIGGRFTLREERGVFHVVPVAVRDGRGEWLRQSSILDTRITLSTEELDGFRLTEAILRAASEASSVRAGLAAENFNNTFARHRGRVAAHDEPARDVLLRTLHAMSPRFTYHLLYDPTGKYYVLGIHIAAEQ